MNSWDGVIWMTEHAERRSQARGIPRNVIELAARYGKAVRAKDGAVRRLCHDTTIRRLVDTGLSKQTADRLDGVSVITKDDASYRAVITVNPRRKKHH